MNTQKPRGKRKTQDPCSGCGLHKSLCLCELIPVLSLKTRISLVIHHRELKRTTNTGMLALKALSNSILRVRGEKDENSFDQKPKALDLSDLLSEEYRTFLFYPSDDAIELDQVLVAQSRQPIQLIVPDGNWRQASKVHYRHPELKGIPRVMIRTANASTRHLRRENTEEGMATLQAIACALAVIEGPEVGDELMRLYQTKLERTLMARGQLNIKD